MKDELIRIAREAGAFFRRDELTDVVSKEGHANYVTNIDCRVQAFLEEELQRLLPGSEFIGEEKENRALTDAATWIRKQAGAPSSTAGRSMYRRRRSGTPWFPSAPRRTMRSWRIPA